MAARRTPIATIAAVSYPTPTRKQCRKRRTAMDRLAMPVTALLL